MTLWKFVRTHPIEIGVISGGTVIFVLALISASPGLLEVMRLHGATIGVFTAGITVGSLFLVRTPSGRVLAPVAVGSAVGLATLDIIAGQPTFTVSTATVVVVIGVALALGQLFRFILGHQLEPHIWAAQLLGTSAVSLLLHNLRYNGDLTWEIFRAAASSNTPLIPLLLAISAVGVLIDLVLTSVVRSERTHQPMVRSVTNQMSEALALTMGLIAAGPLVSLLATVIGLFALPLGLMPMLLTYVAVRRYIANRATYRDTVATLSRLTEVAGYTPERHAERVAAISVAIGRLMGRTAAQLRDLEYAGLLHDLGQVGLARPIPDGATVLAAPGDQRAIAAEGARIVRRTQVLDNVANILDRQTTPFRHAREWGERIPLESRIIKVANAFDDFTAGSTDAADISSALQRINLGLGYEYDPEVVDALYQVAARGTL